MPISIIFTNLRSNGGVDVNPFCLPEVGWKVFIIFVGFIQLIIRVRTRKNAANVAQVYYRNVTSLESQGTRV